MIYVHEPRPRGANGEGGLDRRRLGPDEPIPVDAPWIDLVDPTPEEDRKAEAFLKVSVPTREDMKDIEPSELLYTEDGARYMTARLLCGAETDEPSIAGVTFILTGRSLVTVRYAELRSFHMFAQRASKRVGGQTGESVLAGLIETISDRAADVLQTVGENIDLTSRRIFEEPKRAGRRGEEFRSTLRALGRYGDLASKQRESLVSMERILLFLAASYRATRVPVELREQVRSTLRDLQSLQEHATFLSSKVQFLLDATLGLVNLDQNNIIKLFSVVSVVFMPPTLIASIYGMNFRQMPELEWPLGYPMALILMVVAAVMPYLFFRWKRWL